MGLNSSKNEQNNQMNNQEISEESQDTKNQESMYVCPEGRKYREQSQVYAQEMKKYFQESQLAWKNNKKADAKALSNLGKQSERQMQECSQMAAKIIFEYNNRNKSLKEIDLHGLYVREALQFTSIRIKQLLDKEIYTLVVIVGKGLHSKNGKQRIAPEIRDYCDQCSITYEFNDPNEGCIKLNLESVKKIVQVPEEDLKDQNKECLIM